MIPGAGRYSTLITPRAGLLFHAVFHKRQGIVLRPKKEPAPPFTRESIAEDAKRRADAWRQIEAAKRRGDVA
jgi:hypothetical protein